MLFKICDLFRAGFQCLLFKERRPKCMVENFFSGRGTGQVHRHKETVHLQIGPGDIIDSGIRRMFAKIRRDTFETGRRYLFVLPLPVTLLQFLFHTFQIPPAFRHAHSEKYGQQSHHDNDQRQLLHRNLVHSLLKVRSETVRQQFLQRKSLIFGR